MQFKVHETWTLQLSGEKRVLEREKVKWGEQIRLTPPFLYGNLAFEQQQLM